MTEQTEFWNNWKKILAAEIEKCEADGDMDRAEFLSAEIEFMETIEQMTKGSQQCQNQKVI